MKYLLMIYINEADMLSASEEDTVRVTGAYRAYGEALRSAGVYVASERLRPTNTGTTVRVRDDKTNVLDGPYADTKEQLAGFYMIDVGDLDTALTWAARCPGAAYGAIEVRPIWTM